MIGLFAFILVFSVVPVPIAKAASAPYFSMTFVAPTSNPVRRQWAQIIQNSFVSAGIQVNLIYMSFGQWLGLLFGNSTCPAGKPFIAGGNNCPPPSFANGGWDAGFVGNGGGTVLPDFGTQSVVLYKGDTANDFPPNGQNYNWWLNSTYNNLANDYSTNFNTQARLADAQRMVKIVADQRPGIVIYYPQTPYAWNPSFKPWGTTNAITQTTTGLDWQHWATGTTTTVNAAVTGGLDAVNPLPNPAQNSFYDRYLYGPTNGAAQSGAGAVEEADARGVGVYINAIANKITTSADHLTYTVSFKAHNFQDGVAVTADDYLFTNMAEVVGATAYVAAGTTDSILGNFQQFTYLNGTTDYVNNGAYQHGGSTPSGWKATSIWKSTNATAFSFTLPTPYLFTDPLITGTGALPMHILEQIPFAQLQNSPLSGFTSGCTNGQNIMKNPCPQGGLSQNNFKVTWNTARYGGNGSYKAYGPIGDGAYIYHGYNPTTQTGTLVKFNGYWNATGLQALHEFTISTVNVVSIPGKDAAIAAYGNPISFLDGQYTLNKDDISALRGLGATVITTIDPANGWQEMPLNDGNPIWGIGTGTPAGQKDPSHASTYAKDVRTAFSYLVPRQQIVNSLVQGLGTIGITQFFPTQGVISPGDIYQGVSADPLGQRIALAYLASAGYNTGVNPISQGGQVIPVPQVTVANITLAVPGFFLGNSFTLSGGFPLVPGKTAGVGNFYITLQQSFDSGKTWASVALGIATSGGAYSLSYTPLSTGNQTYRIFFTGIAATYVNGSSGPLRALTVPGPALVESYSPPLAVRPCTHALAGRGSTCAANMTNTQYSATASLNVGTYSSLFTSLANGINTAFQSLAKSTGNSVSAVNTNVGSLSTQLSSLQSSAAKSSDLTALSSQVSTLNGQVSTLTDVAYAALAVAVILGLLAIALSKEAELGDPQVFFPAPRHSGR